MEFRANGKLLLTSEYLVLDGATALALPTRFGQTLSIKPVDGDQLQWQSLDSDGNEWFSALFDVKNGHILQSSDPETAEALLRIIHVAIELNSDFNPVGVLATTALEFDREWGLGSSSTLRVLIAKWASVSAYELHEATSNGSGYDIAAGLSESPILYRNRPQLQVDEVIFNPDFRDSIFFVHLNKKQRSDAEVLSYSKLKEDLDLDYCIDVVTDLTNRLLMTNSLEAFEQLVKEHELFMSNVLQRPTVHESLFPDYKAGVIKSLGAWGGDFILVTCGSEESVRTYFGNKGYTTVLAYPDIIL